MQRGVEGYYCSRSYSGNYKPYVYGLNEASVIEKNTQEAFPIRCIRETLKISLPVVGSVDIPNSTITTTSVGVCSVITNDGGAEVTSRGFCWNTTGEPTVEDNKVIVASDEGYMQDNLIGEFKEGPTYYVRAFATNKKGTGYSEVASFKVCPRSFEVYHIKGINGAPETKKVVYHSINSNVSGKAFCWLTQNLGADRQALSYDDSSENSAGWYWQFKNNQGYKHDGKIRIPDIGWNEKIFTGYWATDPCMLLLEVDGNCQNIQNGLLSME